LVRSEVGAERYPLFIAPLGTNLIPRGHRTPEERGGQESLWDRGFWRGPRVLPSQGRSARRNSGETAGV